MQREEFIHTLLSSTAFLKTPLEALASQSLKDAYVAAKAYLASKLGLNSAGNHALDLALEKPESEVRKALLVEESSDLEPDSELTRLGETLAALLPGNRNEVPAIRSDRWSRPTRASRRGRHHHDDPAGAS